MTGTLVTLKRLASVQEQRIHPGAPIGQYLIVFDIIILLVSISIILLVSITLTTNER